MVASVSKLKSATIRIYRDATAVAEALEIYIEPRTRDASTIHISAALDSSTRSELMELLSSIRPCKPIRSGGSSEFRLE